MTVGKENVSARARPSSRHGKAMSRVDCGQSRRGLSENKPAPADQPVGRTMAMLTSTVARNGEAAATASTDTTSFHELTMQCLPDLNDEWRAVLNTKLTAKKWETKKQFDQQKNLIAKLKECVDVGRQQRLSLMGRAQEVHARLHDELSQLAEARLKSAQANTLRESVETLQGRVQTLEQETKHASQAAQLAEAELQRVDQALQSRENEVEDCTAKLAQGQARAQTAGQDCEREARRIRSDLTTLTTACEALQKAHADLTTQVQSIEADTSDAIRAAERQQQVYDEKSLGLESERRAASDAAAHAETELARLKAAHKVEDDELAVYRTNIAECRAQMDKSKETADRSDVELAALQRDCLRLDQDLGELKARQTAETAEIAALRCHKDKLQQEIACATKNVSSLKGCCDTLQNEHEKLTQLNSDLVDSISAMDKRTKDLNTSSDDSVKQKAQLTGEVELLQKQLSDTNTKQSQASQTESKLSSTRDQLDQEIAALSMRHTNYVTERSALLKQTESLETELNSFKAQNNTAAQQQMELLCQRENEVALAQAAHDAVCEQTREKRDKVGNLRANIELQDARIVQLEAEAIENETLRRQLHNTMCELKGNIRVFCRVRPIKSAEIQDGHHTVIEKGTVDDRDHLQLVAPTARAAVDTRKKDGVSSTEYDFEFDKVFGQSASQETVFEEVSTMVQSALDGYKVCIFAYGQTGSGKTHTMQGGTDKGQDGIIPRSIVHILNEANRLSAQGWHYTMTASFLEIYNEGIRDLLSAQPESRGRKEAWAEKTTKKVDFTIKHDRMGNTVITNMTQISVDSLAKVEELMDMAARQRSVSATAMNSQSSRSHSVFTLRLNGTNEAQGTALSGVLNLIDLAGSERLAQSKASGSRLKETQAINKSLSSLGDVFLALGNKSSHIPYRNSKLTYLLQPCLGGEGKTLMMLNLSPAPESFHESLCSLRFGSKVNSVDLGIFALQEEANMCNSAV